MKTPALVLITLLIFSCNQNKNEQMNTLNLDSIQTIDSIPKNKEGEIELKVVQDFLEHLPIEDFPNAYHMDGGNYYLIKLLRDNPIPLKGETKNSHLKILSRDIPEILKNQYSEFTDINFFFKDTSYTELYAIKNIIIPNKSFASKILLHHFEKQGMNCYFLYMVNYHPGFNTYFKNNILAFQIGGEAGSEVFINLRSEVSEIDSVGFFTINQVLEYEDSKTEGVKSKKIKLTINTGISENEDPEGYFIYTKVN